MPPAWSFFVEVHERAREVRSAELRPLVCVVLRLRTFNLRRTGALLAITPIIGANFVRMRAAVAQISRLISRGVQ
jgi:hypothetical protein